MQNDVLTLEGEPASGTPLLEKVIAGGRTTGSQPTLDQIRIRARQSLQQLPPELRQLSSAPPYPIQISPALELITQQTDLWLQKRLEEDWRRWGDGAMGLP